jgi:hypothetical protein
VVSIDDMSRPVRVQPSGSVATAAPPPPKAPSADDDAPPVAKPAIVHPPEPTDYPTELRPTEPRPYLIVKEVTMEGVHLAFASEWLNHEVFRTSMPIRCAFSGKGAEAKLVSRPIIFLNRVKEGDPQARSLELQYEQNLSGKHSPREHVRTIGRMSELRRPYDLPLLYYAQAGHIGDAICARVHSDPGGKEHCEILLPSGQTAVEWLERVNGRCGPEYALLKTSVATLLSDHWSSLSDKVRKRLETWCNFERGEVFKLYLNDADLTAADAGLGGVVVTDRRLLYHKFRHSRSLSLNQDAVLHLRTDAKYARLTLESHGRLARAGKIHRQDMNTLIQALADAPRLRVAVGRADDAD